MTTETLAARPLYLEDLMPGTIHRSGGEPQTMDAESIKAFARQFDPQPFHLDEALAAGTFFHGLAASGWQTAAVTMKLLVEGGLPLAGGIIGAGVEEVRWPRPVRPGDRLRVETKVLEVRPSHSKPEQGLAKVRTTTLNQNGDPVQVMTSNLLVQRRNGG
ncbi:MAG: MaoC family dehydratase [Xanthobacteraceae bacterium]|nr:MaoC family dehydratase [Xanthobacteraceae bacterium]